MCSQSKLPLLHGFLLLNHVAWITLFYQGDSELLLFPLQKQMEHNLPCLFENLLCCYQLYSFVNTRKSCGFVKAKGFIILFWECVYLLLRNIWSINVSILSEKLLKWSQDSAMRGVPLHVYYIQFVSIPSPWAVAGPHGQLASILWFMLSFFRFLANNVKLYHKGLRASENGHQKRLESLNFWNSWKWLHMIVL